MAIDNRKTRIRGFSPWRGLEALEPRLLMSADGLAPAVEGTPETSAAVVEDASLLLVDESQPQPASAVQYRETDFNFASRLLEEEGIFFFFKHEDGKHTLVLASPEDAHVDAREGEHDVLQAASSLETFTPGGKFTIQEHRSGSEESSTYVVTSIAHTATEPTPYESGTAATEDYQNGFTCSSCWIRASQLHTGKSFGGIDIPRIGEEVIVQFEEGDPDRPIIVGRAYHADTVPPYSLPGGTTVSSLQSSTTAGSGGYNEYVLDDTKGNELIREHGQFDKDSTIENDLREHVLNDRSQNVTNNETIQIGVDRAESVDANETVTVSLMRTHTVGVNETITVGAAR